ncbi:MAG: zinc-ribbon domain-containing protein [Desulfovibrio sp.]|jgi:predicted Zn finger-like uncharacterized protein|nr:zinc-ribbon domain-containing protein [Desulfovibrio sp.]
MEITCPQCTSRFNLPDEHVRAGAKLRCSVCKTVFALEIPAPVQKAPPEPEKPATQQRKKILTKRRFMLLVIVLGLCLAGGVGGIWIFNALNAPKPSTEDEIAKRIEMLTMRNVRQYYVDNEKTGKVFVIEGKVVNEFPKAKALITIEAAIYDKDKKPLVIKKQIAGVQLSLFQLQVLSEKEMETFLNNKLEILVNNLNVPPGGEVPFMTLFYAPPANAAEFGVRIVDVRDAEEPGK